MNDLRRYINLIESVELSEAPIDSFKRGVKNDINISSAQDAQDQMEGTFFGTVVGAALGASIPLFMDSATVDQMMTLFVTSPIGGGLGALVGGAGYGDFTDMSNKKRVYADQALKGKQIKPEIITDLKKFNQYIVNNLPKTISMYALELKNTGYNQTYTDFPDEVSRYTPAEQHYFDDDKDEFEKRTEKLIELLNDYLDKQNLVYDNLAKKHGLTPIQLGAIQYLHLEDEIEETFLKGIQSALTG